MFRLGREDGLESGKAGMAFPCRDGERKTDGQLISRIS